MGGAIVLAHPYKGQVHQNPTPDAKLEQACKSTIFDMVDAVEMLNGRSKNVENNFVYKLCSRLKLKTVGGSDAHSLSDIPTCATLFESDVRTLSEFIHELKEGRFKAIDLRHSASFK